MIYGCDVSFANGGSINWTAVAVSKMIGFVYSRVNEGTNPDNDDGDVFVHNHDGCKSNAIPFGCYSFYVAGQDGAAQAQHFLQAANGRYGELLPMVDIEEDSGIDGWGGGIQQRITNLAAMLDYIEKNLAQPIIYTNEDTWQTHFGGTDAFSGHRLWIASYPAPPGEPTSSVPGFATWTIHQYQSGPSNVPGISGNLDCDVLAGTIAAITR